jgi:hypothetical protein
MPTTNGTKLDGLVVEVRLSAAEQAMLRVLEARLTRLLTHLIDERVDSLRQAIDVAIAESDEDDDDDDESSTEPDEEE